jgi:hypothetical protein
MTFPRGKELGSAILFLVLPGSTLGRSGSALALWFVVARHLDARARVGAGVCG